MLRFDRKQQNSVKQLSFNKKERKKKITGGTKGGRQQDSWEKRQLWNETKFGFSNQVYLTLKPGFCHLCNWDNNYLGQLIY